MNLYQPTISGSLVVTGSSTFYGSVTISGSVSATSSVAISSSYATSASNADFLDGLDSTYFVPSSSYATMSGSIASRATNLESTASVLTSASASFATMSGSLSTRVTKIEGNYATTGSNAFNGSQNITGSLTVSQAVIAQTLNVQQVTSSIVYSCGSNIFGCSTSDVQQMTGSVRITGSGASYFLGGNVGVGTSSPTRLVDISGSAGVLRVQNAGSVGAPSIELGVQNQGSGLFAPSANTVAITTNDTERLRITSGGNFQVTGSAFFSSCVTTGDIITINRTNNDSYIIFNRIGTSAQGWSIGNQGTSIAIYNQTTAKTALSITSGGNVGIGVTNSSWGSGYTALQIGGYGAIWANTVGSDMQIGSNAYYDGTNYRYIASDFATRYLQYNGQHIWGYAASGNNGCSFTFCEAMRISSSGRLGIQVDAPSENLQVAGNVRAGNTVSGTSFNGGSPYIGVAGGSGQSALFIAHSSGYGVAYFGYDSCSDRLVVATDCGGGNNKIDFILNAGTSIDGTTNNLSTSVCPIMRITAGGKIAIGNTDPQYTLDLSGGDIDRIIQFYGDTGTDKYGVGKFGGSGATTIFHGTAGATNRVSLGCFNGTTYTANFEVLGNGVICMINIGSGAGTYALKWNSTSKNVTYDTSSERYKNNIRNSIYGLCHVMRLNSRMFEYKDQCRTDVGLVAEEVYPVIPELVALDDSCLPNGVSYDRFVSVLVKAIQEQQCKINILESCLGIN